MRKLHVKVSSSIAVISFAVFLIWLFVRPMNIFVVDEKFERPVPVNIPAGLASISATECKECHEEIYREWSESMHAKAWTDPYYQVDYIYDGSQQICLNCHIPFENQQENLVLGFKDKEKFRPILKPNPNFDPALRDEGVTCVVCHIKEGKIVGPFGVEGAPHSVIADPEMISGIKFCEKCHVVSGKRWDTFYRIPPCGTVAEIGERDEVLDCVGCHMPEVIRPLVKGLEPRKGGKHFFRGGHHPETVRKSLRVEYKKEFSSDKGKIKYIFTLTNIGAAHYLPTGTPDRHLTLELRLLNKEEKTLKEKKYKMKRYIMWRPVIADIKDTRLPFNEPRNFVFEFKPDSENQPSVIDVTVRYHLLDEKQRKKIGYENKEPIAYPIYNKRITL
jgi:Cytochrome c554 and c-prime